MEQKNLNKTEGQLQFYQKTNRYCLRYHILFRLSEYSFDIKYKVDELGQYYSIKNRGNASSCYLSIPRRRNTFSSSMTCIKKNLCAVFSVRISFLFRFHFNKTNPICLQVGSITFQLQIKMFFKKYIAAQNVPSKLSICRFFAP